MACSAVTVEVKGLLRPCMVGKRKALFHRWTQESKIIPPSSFKGGDSGGQLSTTVGIIEWDDGTIHGVYPYEIRFLDTQSQMAEFGECYPREGVNEYD